MNSRIPPLAAVLASVMFTFAQAAPYPRPSMPEGVMLGLMQPNAPVTVTVALKLQNEAQLQSRLAATYAPGNPLYHHYLASGEFASTYGPDAATVDKVTKRFQSQGLSVNRVSTHAAATHRQRRGDAGSLQYAAAGRSRFRPLRRPPRIAIGQRAAYHNRRRTLQVRFKGIRVRYAAAIPAASSAPGRQATHAKQCRIAKWWQSQYDGSAWPLDSGRLWRVLRRHSPLRERYRWQQADHRHRYPRVIHYQ